MNIENAVAKQFEQTIVEVDEYQRTGRKRPAWLQKKVDAVYLSETEPEQGLAMLIDGLHDQMMATKNSKLEIAHG